MALSTYTLALSPSSPMFTYLPVRDGPVAAGWNSSYTDSPIWPVEINDTGTFVTSSPAGRPYYRTEFDGATVALNFQGTGAYICFTTNAAAVSGTVGDSPIGPAALSATAVGTSCKDSGSANILEIKDLPADQHTITLRASASANSQFQVFGGGITLSAKGDGPMNDDTKIDDQDPAWDLRPGRLPAAKDGWDTSTGSQFYRGAYSFECNYDDAKNMNYVFSGASGVVVNGLVQENTKAFSVTLDGKTTNLVGSTLWPDNAVLFAQGGLDPDTVYKITITNRNSDIPDCAGFARGRFRLCCVNVDSLILLQPGNATTTPGPVPVAQVTSSKHSSSLGAIVGGVVGGIILLAAIGFLVFFLRRRRRQSQFKEPQWTVDPSYDAMTINDATPGSYVPTPNPLIYPGPGYQPSTTGAQTSTDGAQSVVAPPNSTTTESTGPRSAGATRKDGKLAVLTAPVQTSPSPGSVGSSDRPALAESDLERVLSFVARRMDASAPSHSPDSHSPDPPPPRYQG